MENRNGKLGDRKLLSAELRFVRKLAILVALWLMVASCDRSTPPTAPASKSLELLTSYALSVTEPSGLAYSPATESLYMISDNRAEIFKIDTTGKVLASIPVSAVDIEGVAVSANGDTLYIVEETAGRVSTMLADGKIRSSFLVTVRTDPKHALEGITVDHRGHLFVINEKTPAMLLEFIGQTEARRLTLDYTLDISDICYDAASDGFWIVSDESRQVIKISRSGALLGAWSSPVPQGEGIAVIGQRLYVVSDIEAKLYIFRKPS